MVACNFGSVFSIFSLVMSVLLIRLHVISDSITGVSFLHPIQIQKESSQHIEIKKVLLETETRQDHEAELQYRSRISGCLAD